MGTSDPTTLTFVVRRGQESWGPLTLATMRTFVETGVLRETDEASAHGHSDWCTLARLLAKERSTSQIDEAATAPARRSPRRVIRALAVPSATLAACASVVVAISIYRAGAPIREARRLYTEAGHREASGQHEAAYSALVAAHSALLELRRQSNEASALAADVSDAKERVRHVLAPRRASKVLADAEANVARLQLLVTKAEAQHALDGLNAIARELSDWGPLAGLDHSQDLHSIEAQADRLQAAATFLADLKSPAEVARLLDHDPAESFEHFAQVFLGRLLYLAVIDGAPTMANVGIRGPASVTPTSTEFAFDVSRTDSLVSPFSATLIYHTPNHMIRMRFAAQRGNWVLKSAEARPLLWGGTSGNLSLNAFKTALDPLSPID